MKRQRKAVPKRRDTRVKCCCTCNDLDRRDLQTDYFACQALYHNTSQLILNSLHVDEVSVCNKKTNGNCSNQDGDAPQCLQVICTIQIKITANTQQTQDVVIAWAADYWYMREAGDIFVKNDSRFRADFAGLFFVTKKRNGKQKDICCAVICSQ